MQLANVYVGTVGGESEELYRVTVCTPGKLAELLAEQQFLLGRHWLFLPEFSPRAAEAVLRKMIGKVSETPSSFHSSTSRAPCR